MFNEKHEKAILEGSFWTAFNVFLRVAVLFWMLATGSGTIISYFAVQLGDAPWFDGEAELMRWAAITSIFMSCLFVFWRRHQYRKHGIDFRVDGLERTIPRNVDDQRTANDGKNKHA